ncbi:hypothetical protein A0H76_76 [Hepatospora eriocheir]|uniref:Uncharacterized protein n=1 Tax=Hepatospora eriocheir TaxID=1081669 RepID=A0A1X0QJ92_9MICR|nr:hypothetical protein A0H76_76 [Hepatospora eriocheir]
MVDSEKLEDLRKNLSKEIQEAIDYLKEIGQTLVANLLIWLSYLIDLLIKYGIIAVIGFSTGIFLIILITVLITFFITKSCYQNSNDDEN